MVNAPQKKNLSKKKKKKKNIFNIKKNDRKNFLRCLV